MTAGHVARDKQKTDTLRTACEEEQSARSEYERAPLEIIEPGDRSLVRSLLHYIDAMQQQYPDETLTVVLPEFAEGSFLKRLLHNPIILRLKISLFFRPEIVVTNLTLPAQNNTLPLRPKDVHQRVIVPVAVLDRVSLQSLSYARSISKHVTASHVAM